MAQVMSYYEFPAGYDYDDMPDNNGTMETARLIRDIADAVNMNWGCDGSGANTKKEIASSFVNDFGYSSSVYADFDQSTVKGEI